MLATTQLFPSRLEHSRRHSRFPFFNGTAICPSLPLPSLSRASISFLTLASCLAERSPIFAAVAPPEAAFLARFLFEGCNAVEAGSGRVSGTYAQPGADVVFAPASSMTPKLFMVGGDASDCCRLRSPEDDEVCECLRCLSGWTRHRESWGPFFAAEPKPATVVANHGPAQPKLPRLATHRPSLPIDDDVELPSRGHHHNPRPSYHPPITTNLQFLCSIEISVKTTRLLTQSK